jgi:uncharacterized membrane-anchored protein
MRNLVLLISLVVILMVVNYSIWQREKLSSTGRPILLELAPVDPRSLMQGDYMALRFKITSEAFPHDTLKGMKDGSMVLGVDSRNVATFRRFANSPAAADEVLLRYRIRNGQPKFASNAFFFQERQGDAYSDAKFGEFRVSSSGEALLVALRNADLQQLGSSVATHKQK